MQDVLINADYWTPTPQLLSANFGFEGIMGVLGNQAVVIAADGAWQTLITPNHE